MLDRRLQVLLDKDRYDRLAAEARARGTSVASIVRDAIDKAFPTTSAAKRAAGRRILEAPDMPVPSVEGLRRELDEAHDRWQ
jgi:hypothetical protein